jgi:hypothetical protein
MEGTIAMTLTTILMQVAWLAIGVALARRAVS